MVIHLAVKLFVPGIDKNGKITMAYIKNKKGNSIYFLLLIFLLFILWKIKRKTS